MADVESIRDDLQEMEILDGASGIADKNNKNNDEKLEKKENLSNIDSICGRMLARVSKTDAHFKHQQRDEPDLTEKEKYDIASEILEKNASTFLSRFGKYLAEEDLEYFKNRTDEYEINFYLNQIRKENSKVFSANRVKNRRYEAMKQLVSQGEYFSEDEMKYRDPLLYEQLIGQFLSNKDIQEKVDKADLRFSSILLKHMDRIDEENLYNQQKEKEESQMEESDDDDDEEIEIEEEEEMESDEDDDEKPLKKISKVKKQELKEEFLRIMQERFLAGQDANFDYSKVDNNDQYDDLDVLDRDEEEKYFDSEEWDS